MNTEDYKENPYLILDIETDGFIDKKIGITERLQRQRFLNRQKSQFDGYLNTKEEFLKYVTDEEEISKWREMK